MKYQIKPILLLFFIFGCTPVQYPNYTQIAQSNKGVISTAHPLATLAGEEMLQMGGNAVDAAVASAFALSVVEPSMSGLGGRLQAIVHLPNGEIHGVDATSQAPIKYDTATTPNVRYGYEVIGIPGVVAGLTKLLSEHGSLPLKKVIAPAIRYAQNGFPILKGEAQRHAMAIDYIKKFKGTSQYYLKDGVTHQQGTLLVQTDLANTLRQIAKGGRDAFYKGKIATQIAADMKANGGIVTMEDLANYEAKSSKILSGNYRGYDLHGLWMPSFGAITIEIFHILENFPLDEFNEAEWAYVMNQAIALAYEDRLQQRDPNTAATIATLTSKKYAKELAERIQSTMKTSYQPTNHIPESWVAEVGHTTHLSAADDSGLMIALTQSLGPNMGSKVATPGLGFLYAVTLGRYLGIYEPGQRASSHISPFLITKDGKPYMALGAAGGSRIIPAVVHVTTRLIDQGMTLEQALAAPRVHPDQDTILLETHLRGGWKPKVLKDLEEKGINIRSIPDRGRFGRVHAVLYNPQTNMWTGGADPDWEGVVAGEK